jgi:DNA-binding MarR family transcriptional regulator
MPDHHPSIEPAALAAELRAVVGKLTRRLRENAPPPGDLSWSQARILGRLEREGPQTLSTLARSENMRSQSMRAIIGPLEEAGFVVGAPDPNDGRQTLLSITEKGRATIVENRRSRDDWLAERIGAAFTAEDRKVLAHAAALLDRIASG